MALWFELLLSGVLPIAFALWQIRDVRREQRRRAEQRRLEEASAAQGCEQAPSSRAPSAPQAGDGVPPASRG